MVRRAGPGFGAGSGDRDEELLFVLACEAEGMSRREMAIAIWGQDRVADEYFPGCWMQSRIKRRLDWAKAIVKHYREIATGSLPPLNPAPAEPTPLTGGATTPPCA